MIGDRHPVGMTDTAMPPPCEASGIGTTNVETMIALVGTSETTIADTEFLILHSCHTCPPRSHLLRPFPPPPLTPIYTNNNTSSSNRSPPDPLMVTPTL
ncbi:hypothetical protein Pst134EB_018512 [Puccinia striiformis f. sp. tritici]|nr:hypothetical protein Pst134EB_018512 [Puccinia striiformis f. sp. tritici]